MTRKHYTMPAALHLGDEKADDDKGYKYATGAAAPEKRFLGRLTETVVEHNKHLETINTQLYNLNTRLTGEELSSEPTEADHPSTSFSGILGDLERALLYQRELLETLTVRVNCIDAIL